MEKHLTIIKENATIIEAFNHEDDELIELCGLAYHFNDDNNLVSSSNGRVVAICNRAYFSGWTIKREVKPTHITLAEYIEQADWLAGDAEKAFKESASANLDKLEAMDGCRPWKIWPHNKVWWTGDHSRYRLPLIDGKLPPVAELGYVDIPICDDDGDEYTVMTPNTGGVSLSEAINNKLFIGYVWPHTTGETSMKCVKRCKGKIERCTHVIFRKVGE